jgi:hypothetical protein
MRPATTVPPRRAILAGSAVILALTLAPFLFSASVFAQSEKTFAPNDKFEIPELNGLIRFATDGTYEEAYLENSSWRFVNLFINSSFTTRKLNLAASAENSDVTILSYRVFNVTFTGVSLRYNVSGIGKQVFTFGELPRVGEWSIAFNGVFMGENDGWSISSDRKISLTPPTGNVSITFYSLPDSFGNVDDESAPFYQRHSVAVATSIALVVTVCVTAAIWRLNKTRSKQSTKNSEG